MKLPDVSIITVNYNGLWDTYEFIDSLQLHLKINYELIVVDNGSFSDELNGMTCLYPGIISLRSRYNLGFSGGNNLGIKHSCGRYLLFLNNDTYITDNSISELISFMDSHPQVGGVSPKLKYSDGRNIIQYAGSTALSNITIRNQVIGQGEYDKGQFDTACCTHFLHGAAMLVRREVIERVGLMPEIYFLYYEEIDWSSRIKENGYELWYIPQCTVYHKESRTVGKDSCIKVYYMSRNRLLYSLRNRKGIDRILSHLYLLYIVGGRDVLRYIIRGDFNLAIGVIRGHWSYFNLFIKRKLLY